MSPSRRIVVIGDEAQPAAQTAAALTEALPRWIDIVALDWNTAPFGGFTQAAFAAEAGLDIPVPEDWLPSLSRANALITHFFPITAYVADLVPGLQLVATLRTGSEHIAAAVASRGVEIINNPGREADAVSDYAAAMILDAARRVTLTDRAFRASGWDVAVRVAGRPRNLRELTIGLVGFGHVARLVIRKLAGFRPAILVADPFAKPAEVAEFGARLAELDELLLMADIVSLHARLTDQTRGLLGPAELASMRAGAWLVNTARAELIDKAALSAALESRQLGGATLDVFWAEPPAEHDPLLEHPNVVLTPHLAGTTTTSQFDSVRLLSTRVATWVCSHWPRQAKERR